MECVKYSIVFDNRVCNGMEFLLFKWLRKQLRWMDNKEIKRTKHLVHRTRFSFGLKVFFHLSLEFSCSLLSICVFCLVLCSNRDSMCLLVLVLVLVRVGGSIFAAQMKYFKSMHASIAFGYSSKHVIGSLFFTDSSNVTEQIPLAFTAQCHSRVENYIHSFIVTMNEPRSWMKMMFSCILLPMRLKGWKIFLEKIRCHFYTSKLELFHLYRLILGLRCVVSCKMQASFFF